MKLKFLVPVLGLRLSVYLVVYLMIAELFFRIANGLLRLDINKIELYNKLIYIKSKE